MSSFLLGSKSDSPLCQILKIIFDIYGPAAEVQQHLLSQNFTHLVLSVQKHERTRTASSRLAIVPYVWGSGILDESFDHAYSEHCSPLGSQRHLNNS